MVRSGRFDLLGKTWSSRTVSDTRERILDAMQSLIQTRGYSAVSYQDIAGELGVRKASIHYHFATKQALGIAVIERYGQRIDAALGQAMQGGTDPWKLLDAYLGPFREFGSSDDKICLCGALAGEFLALPDEMQSMVTEFFDQHQQWLQKLLSSGRKSGAFSFTGSPRRLARLTFSALQGALLVKRTNGDVGQIRDVVAELRARLKSR